MYRSIAFALACVFLFASIGCAPSGNTTGSIPQGRVSFANNQNEAKPIAFRKLTVHTKAGTFTYSNGAVERTMTSGHDALAVHVPNGEVIWGAPALGDIQMLDDLGHIRKLDLHGLEPFVCSPESCGGGGGGGGGCIPSNDVFGSCSTTEYYNSSEDAGCYGTGADCGFNSVGIGVGQGEILYPDQSGCWINYATSPYYFDCWSNFNSVPWFHPPQDLYSFYAWNPSPPTFGLTCKGSGTKGYMLTHYTDTGLFYQNFGIYNFVNKQYTWTNPGNMNDLFFAPLPAPSDRANITLQTTWYKYWTIPYAIAYCNYPDSL